MELLGLIFIFALRFLIPLSIFRWPLWGGVASLVADALDTNIVKPFGADIPNYIVVDKFLDIYYLSIELIVSLSWFNRLAKNTSIVLFVLRTFGFLAFFVTNNEFWLFTAPNLFENFFLFYLILLTLKIETRNKIWLNSYKRLAVSLLLLFVSKLPQEITLHLWKVPFPLETFFSWLKNL